MFTKIYYINLDRRTDRRKHMEEQLDNINYNGSIIRFPAVDGNTLNYNDLINDFQKESLDDAFGIKKSSVNTSKGALGCALSHKKIYQKVLEGNDDYVLILEDDVTIVPDFINKINNLQVNNFDILWLGYHFAGVKENYSNYMIPHQYLYGLFGYVINKKAAKVLLDIFPTRMQLDSEIPKTFNYLKVYAVKEDNKLVLSDRSETSTTFGTDIQRIDIKYNNKFINDVRSHHNDQQDNERIIENFTVTKNQPNNLLKSIIIILVLLSIVMYQYKFNY
jgi:glycosyl transferase family 25